MRIQIENSAYCIELPKRFFSLEALKGYEYYKGIYLGR